MPTLTATKPLRYAGQSLKVGDKFEASDKDARLLKAIGKAGAHAAEAPDQTEQPAMPEPVKGKYQTRRMKAADGAKDATEE